MVGCQADSDLPMLHESLMEAAISPVSRRCLPPDLFSFLSHLTPSSNYCLHREHWIKVLITRVSQEDVWS